MEAGLQSSEKVKKLENEKDTFESKISPKLYSSFLKKITFYWFINFFRLVKKKKTINLDDLWDLEDDMKIQLISNKFNQELFKEKNRIRQHNKLSDKKLIFSDLNLIKVIWKVLKIQFLISFFLKILNDFITFTFPILLSLMINFISNNTEFKWHGYIYCLLFLISSFLKYFTATFQTALIYKVAFNLRTCLLNLIYSKSLNLSPQSRKNKSIGELITLSNVDCNKFVEAAPYAIFIFSSPLQIIIGIYLLHKQLGN